MDNLKSKIQNLSESSISKSMSLMNNDQLEKLENLVETLKRDKFDL